MLLVTCPPRVAFPPLLTICHIYHFREVSQSRRRVISRGNNGTNCWPNHASKDEFTTTMNTAVVYSYKKNFKCNHTSANRLRPRPAHSDIPTAPNPKSSLLSHRSTSRYLLFSCRATAVNFSHPFTLLQYSPAILPTIPCFLPVALAQAGIKLRIKLRIDRPLSSLRFWLHPYIRRES